MAVRYFPVCQDINADEEVWELTDKFGDRALRVWLEILSIADRNNGYLPGRWDRYPSILAGRCKSTTRHLVTVCQWVTRWLVIDSEGVARVNNYAKYHKLRAERGLAPNHPNHSSPNLPKNHPKKDDSKIPLKRQKPKTPYPDDFEISEELREWCSAQKIADLETHLEAFRDYHVARGSRFIDWPAAFRNWIRNSFRFSGKTNPEQKEGQLSARTMRILRRGL